MNGVIATNAISTLPFFALFGLIFGSFVGALSYRLPRGKSVADGRSACPACGAELQARDLIPVISWIRAKGACRHCGARISWRYPVIELTVAALFTLAAVVVEDVTQLALILAMSPVMVALAVIDFEHCRLPDPLIVPLGALSLGVRYVADAEFLVAGSTALVVFAAALLLDHLGRRLWRQGLGMGDAKLMAVVALALPLEALLQTFVGAGLIGVITGMVWHVTRRPGGHYPFGPAILTSFWGALVLL